MLFFTDQSTEHNHLNLRKINGLISFGLQWKRASAAFNSCNKFFVIGQCASKLCTSS